MLRSRFMDLSNNEVIHVKKDGIEYLQFRRLLQYKGLVHAYSLKPIDIKGKTKDDESFVKLCNALGLDNTKIVAPIQTHTNTVEVALEDSKSSDFDNVDGLVTSVKNKVLSACFADCNSLFLYDPVKNVIGNIHSGWRGTVAKIGKVAVHKMIDEFGCNPKDIICCTGPSIRACHFEVEDDVKNIFMEVFHNDEALVKKSTIKDGKQKYYIDCILAIKKTLIDCGLIDENIVDCGICTVCNSNVLHSYRTLFDKAGRNCSLMSLV